MDVTYLTGPGVVAAVDPPAASRFAHTTRHDVVPLARAVWGDAPTVYVDALDRVGQVLTTLDEPWVSWRGSRVEVDRVASTTDATADALELAGATAADGKQRALDHEAGSLEELKQLRVEVRQLLADDGVTGVSAWLWSAAATDGSPMTEAGRRVGYELRFPRSRSW